MSAQRFLKKFCMIFGAASFSGGAIFFAIFGAIFFAIFEIFAAELPLDPEISPVSARVLLKIMGFSAIQATLSAALSVFFGFFIARAFFYGGFFARRFFILACQLAVISPVIVISLAILQIFSPIFSFFGSKIYGLFGIVFVHFFLNAPFCALIFLQNFRQIPKNEFQVAENLGIFGINFIKFIEFPRMKSEIFRTFWLVFVLAFSSFGAVLLLGGGIRFSTLQVLIYQSIFFDLSISNAVKYAILQIFFCGFVMLFFAKIPKFSSTNRPNERLFFRISRVKKRFITIFLCAFLAFLCAPFLVIFCSGIAGIFSNLYIFHSEIFIKSVAFSLGISGFSATLSVLFAIFLLIFSRNFEAFFPKFVNFSPHFLIFIVILIIPPTLLGFGLYIFLLNFSPGAFELSVIVTLLNAIFCLPFCIKFLEIPMKNAFFTHENLCESLKISGFLRLRIYFFSLRNPVIYALCISFCFALGDFGAIIFFYSENFLTLPIIIYQSMGAYRFSEAQALSFVLLFFCGATFFLSQFFKDTHD